MLLKERIQQKREDILRISKKYGAFNVRLFGSVVRNETSDTSAIDILVNMNEGRSLFDLGGLLMDLKELLECEVDVVTEKGLRARIRDRVLKEAVPI
jgi:hypothetical protein